jgi:hypothetical protein
LPTTFLIKLIPNIFDSLIPILILKSGRSKGDFSARKAALFYTYNPVAIILTSFHGQWDAMWIFFGVCAVLIYRNNFSWNFAKKTLLAGIFFTTSFFVKPSGILLICAVLPPLYSKMENKIRLIINFFIGAFSVLILNIIIAFSLNLDLVELVTHALKYATSGFGVFGTPKGMFALGANTFRVMFLLIFLVAFYLRHKGITAENVAVFTIGAYLSIGALAPQYLIWIIPFLLISRRYYETIAVTFVFSIFLVLYYLDPLASYLPYENSATFTPLMRFSELAPYLNYKYEIYHGITTILNWFADYTIPAIFFLLAINSLRTPRLTEKKIKISKKTNFKKIQNSNSVTSLRMEYSRTLTSLFLYYLFFLIIPLFMIPTNFVKIWDDATSKTWTHYDVDLSHVNLKPFRPPIVGREQGLNFGFECEMIFACLYVLSLCVYSWRVIVSESRVKK